MKNYPQVNWAEVCRQAIESYVKQNPKPLNQMFDNFKPDTSKQNQGKSVSKRKMSIDSTF